ncbi:MAG: DUF4288 domain-containing protein [Planctomycetaceae bacterium]
MNNDTDELRFSAKLLFQFRVDTGAESGKRRLCEERIITFRASSSRTALSVAKRKGKQAEHHYENNEGNRVYFEFVGIVDLLALETECATDEVWYDIKERLLPMERRDKLIPPEDQLCALRNEQARRNRR